MVNKHFKSNLKIKSCKMVSLHINHILPNLFYVYSKIVTWLQCRRLSKKPNKESKSNQYYLLIIIEHYNRMIKEQRNAMMTQLLEPAARERLANISAVKPEKAE